MFLFYESNGSKAYDYVSIDINRKVCDCLTYKKRYIAKNIININPM